MSSEVMIHSAINGITVHHKRFFDTDIEIKPLALNFVFCKLYAINIYFILLSIICQAKKPAKCLRKTQKSNIRFFSA